MGWWKHDILAPRPRHEDKEALEALDEFGFS